MFYLFSCDCVRLILIFFLVFGIEGDPNGSLRQTWATIEVGSCYRIKGFNSGLT